MAVGGEDGGNRDGATLPRTPGGFEMRYDAGNWSALVAAHRAGVDRDRLRRHRAGPSESRTREPGATSQIARTYDYWIGVSPVCIRWGQGFQSQCQRQTTLRGYGSARPCQTQTHRYVDPLLQNRKSLQGPGRVDRDNLNSPDAPLDTRTVTQCVVKRQMFMTLGWEIWQVVVRTWSFVGDSAYRSGTELEIEEPWDGLRCALKPAWG